jgi:hypothetical protein
MTPPRGALPQEEEGDGLEDAEEGDDKLLTVCPYIVGECVALPCAAAAAARRTLRTLHKKNPRHQTKKTQKAPSFASASATLA